MNKVRREAVEAIWATIDDAKGQIEALKDEEQEYFDNMPEAFQQGEKGQAAEAAVSEMEDAMQSLEDACSSLSNVTQ